MFDAFRKIGYRDFWQEFSDCFTLCGVVVDIDKAIRSEIKLLSNFSDAFCFWTPIGADGHEILSPQNHHLVCIEDFEGIQFVVFTSDRKENASSRDRFDRALEIAVATTCAIFR